MIAAFKINFRKDSGSSHHIEHIIQARNGKAILDRDFIDGATIYAHPPRSVFLRCQKCWNSTRAKAFSDEPLLE
ncbi:hypothetical protein AXF42_Ash005851 [Apostasia shenzhenica]|uniref:Uncharacterized protein n=1 Tax=Apostasia shenzhenica TaxID=1088818 RepID=A0A2I0BCK5_9ASPA|nr:hypothetical protein AXF42_Ash005851 [Apostasia shenzhenica]